jgi:hypothetical protein
MNPFIRRSAYLDAKKVTAKLNGEEKLVMDHG